MERFEDWAVKMEKFMAEVLLKLSKQLPDDGEGVWKALSEVEGKLGFFQFCLAIADRHLDQAESEKLSDVIREHGKLIPAYEKETRVKAMVSPQRELRDEIKGLVSAIETRIMLGQSRMRFLRDLNIDNTRSN